MNADPRAILRMLVLLNQISYREAIEFFYGAKRHSPKTPSRSKERNSIVCKVVY